MRAPIAALALMSLVGLSACATAAAQSEQAAASAPADRDCFRNEDIDGFSVVDDDTIKVSVSPQRDYLLSANRIGRDLRFSNSVAVIARPAGWICTGNGLGVEVAGGDIPLRAPVRSITRAPQEAPAQETPAQQTPAGAAPPQGS